MNPEQIAETADAIYREKVLRARRMIPSTKMGLGAELYRESLGRMISGIRSQFPDTDKTGVEEILRKRLRRLQQLDDHAIFDKATSR